MNTKKNLVETMTEYLHEVTLDQIGSGDWVVVYDPERGDLSPREATLVNMVCWARSRTGSRFFVADPLAPEYAPGTLARIAIDYGDAGMAVRMKTCADWLDLDGLMWHDSKVRSVEVIAYPDGSRPVPKVTDEDVYEALIVAGEYDTEARKGDVNGAVGQGFRVALEDFAARKFGGQA